MIWKPRIKARLGRVKARRAVRPPATAASSPHEGLLQAAQSGQFEALVREARPVEPVAMVTPEEREAELRASGQWPAEKREPSAAPSSESEAPPEPPPELTPNEQYIAEHCHWRRRGLNDYRERHRPGRCLTEYDVLADADEGYDFGDGDDDEW
ncbi:MAG: hypothetical protein J0J01_19755 [Reyranella sp.]|uniref:hypothetical protein n=1 Tax=Reyranella sp. TaxID=1929291 RepID=UPI001AD26EBA|nr:hypothetical protein [Reyranella sp.]MBN9089148.1 hypothetical protein [Reyranella sp.]